MFDSPYPWAGVVPNGTMVGIFQRASSPPLEEYGVEHREVVRAYVLILYFLTTPAGATRHPSNGGELAWYLWRFDRNKFGLIPFAPGPEKCTAFFGWFPGEGGGPRDAACRAVALAQADGVVASPGVILSLFWCTYPSSRGNAGSLQSCRNLKRYRLSAV